MSNPEISDYLEKIRNELQSVSGNTDDVEDKLDNVISELQDIEVDIETVDVNTDDVETKLDSVIAELQDVDANTDTVESELQDVNSELDSIQLNTNNLETLLNSTISELQDIETDVESVDTNTDNVEPKLDSIISELQDIESDVENVDTNTDTLESELQDVNSELDTIQLNTDNVETLLNSVISELQDVEADIESVDTNTDTVESELQDVNTELDSIDNLIDELEDALQSIGTDQLRTDIENNNAGLLESSDQPLDVSASEVDVDINSQTLPQVATNLEQIGGQTQSAVDVADKIDQIEDALETVGTDELRTVTYADRPDGERVLLKADGVVFETDDELNANETFTSQWIDTDDYRSIELFITSDVTSAPGGITIEFTDDAQAATPTVRGSLTRTFDNASVTKGYVVFKIPPQLDGYRVKYENGGTATSNFYLASTIRVDDAEATTGPLTGELEAKDSVQYTRSVIAGQNSNDNTKNVRVQNIDTDLNLNASRETLLTYLSRALQTVQNDELRTRAFGQQPDGDLKGEKADGQLFIEKGALNAGETFTSSWFSTDGYRTIEIFVESDTASAIDGVEIEYTEDVTAGTPTVEGAEIHDFKDSDAERGWRTFFLDAQLDGFRLKYTQSPDEPTTSEFTIVGTARTEQSLESPDYVTEALTGDQIVRIGNEPGGQGLKIGNPSSLFGDIETIERKSVIDISSSFGTSILRDEISTTGSGAITENPGPTGEIKLETGTTAGSTIDVRTAEYGRYVPGFSAQAGMGIRLPDPLPTSGEVRWGYYDENNGFYFGYDGDQGEMFVARLKDGTESQRVYRSDWNGADIDERLGRDVGEEWTPSEGDIFQIDFSWYGYGIVVFSIVSQTDDTRAPVTPTQDAVRLHALKVEFETSTSDPNEPIRIEADNEGTTDNVEVYFGGRQFSIYGNSPADERITAETRAGQTIQNGAWTYVMGWRRGDPTNDANSSLDVQGLDFGIDQTARVALLINPNVSGQSYGTPSLVNPNETLLDVSITGTFNGIGSGTKIWEGTVRVAGQGNAQSSIDPDITAQLGQNNTLVLVAQGIGGTGSAISTMRMIEDW